MNSTTLKIIAVISMVIDHVGMLFFPQSAEFRIIGRLAFPIFAFLIANGVIHTTNFRKYIGRLAIFALISQIPFYIFTRMLGIEGFPLNIFFTLTLGGLILHLYTRVKNIYISVLATLGIIVLSHFVNYDYGLYGVMLIVSYYIFRKNMIFGSLAILVSTIYYYAMPNFFVLQVFSLLAILIIALYKDDAIPSKKYRWIFYWFYPAHLAVLSLIRYFTV